MVPLRIPDFLFCYVLPDALEYLSGIFRCAGTKTDSQAFVDLQAAMALGISRHPVSPRRRTVCLRLLQRNADFHCAWLYYNASFQTTELVRLLPYGNDDTADLQSQKQNKAIMLWKESVSCDIMKAIIQSYAITGIRTKRILSER